MAHVQANNIQLTTAQDGVTSAWKLSRTLLAAGWKYKASGDAVAAKESAGVHANDTWAIGGGVNLVQVGSQTGTTATIGTPSSNVSLITGVTGFVTNSVGRFLVLTGYLNAKNNGVFRITAQGGTTVSIWNPNAVAETGTTTTLWTEKHGGAVASIAAAGTAGATPGRAIITGLTGMSLVNTTPVTGSRGSQGNRLIIIGAATGANNGAFLITRIISATSVEIENSAAASDANNGSIIWAESNPMEQVYPSATLGSATAGQWINLQGPSTLKIPLNTNTPTGTFFKGENITQTTTGATGEVIGVVVDTSGGLGYLVVQPRLNGTGGGVRGWSTGNVITGGLSGATVTQSGTAIEFVRELVIWRGTTTLLGGHVFAQCVDASAESASRFSVLATNAAVTNVLAPGGPTGTFPTLGSFVILGQGGSNAATTGPTNWQAALQSATYGVTQVAAANCIGASGVSEDGSFTIAYGQGSSTTPGAYTLWGWHFCENSEDGDVDPYVVLSPINSGAYASSRTNISNGLNIGGNDFGHASVLNTSSTHYRGWRRRGMASADSFQEFSGFTLGANNSTSVFGLVTGNPDRLACVINTTVPVLVREQVWIISTQVSSKMRKGTLRWIFSVQSAVTGALYGNGLYFAIGTNSGSGPLIVGPWNGVPAPNG